MKAGEIWGLKGGAGDGGLLRIDGTEDGHVLAHPRFGGFALRIPEGEFSAKFELYPQDVLDRLAGEFEPTLVGLDSFDEGQEIPCWTAKGVNWNGWEVPFFEREHLDAALTDGRISGDAYVSISFDEAVGSYVELMSNDGTLTKDIDRRALIEAALMAGGGDEVTLPDGSSVYVSIAPFREIQTPGGPVKAYAVGDGWTWSRPPEPQVSSLG